MRRGFITEHILSAKGIWTAGAVVLRVIAGLVVARFGLEMFAAEKMAGYRDWLTDLGLPCPVLLAFAGKIGELSGGILLALGLFTKLAAFILVIVMSVISFVMGKPDVLNPDLSLMLLLIFLHFLFTGPGPWSMDHLVFKNIPITRKN